jgi:pimeloyl-ACP methyl ester carboxylesterase
MNLCWVNQGILFGSYFGIECGIRNKSNGVKEPAMLNAFSLATHRSAPRATSRIKTKPEKNTHGPFSKKLRWICFLIPLVVVNAIANAADKEDQRADDNDGSKPCAALEEPSWKMKTLGGRQFWGDVHFFRGWKIQQNIITGHYRLLDQRDNRYKAGTFKTCKKKLDEITEKCELKSMKDEKVVIVVHGIIRSSKSMKKMKARLEQEGFLVVPFDYPSTRVSMEKCASYLGRTIASLQDVKEVNFVTHSMGGLIVRSWAADNKNTNIGRFVMMGTPNKGAELADRLKDWKVFKYILGPAGQELVSDDNGKIAKLPIPKFPFAIVAGAKGTKNGYNPLIPGDDDGTVALSSARLEGASDFMSVPTLHSFLISNPTVVDSVARYLKTGAFRANGEREPIALGNKAESVDKTKPDDASKQPKAVKKQAAAEDSTPNE